MRHVTSTRITLPAAKPAFQCRLLLPLAAMALLSGCRGATVGGVSISAADRKEAHEIYQTRCATCHGQFGRGDGPGAAALNPKPQNYADEAWQAKVTDAEIEKAIVEGGAAVGKSPQMVPNPDLAAKPGVVAALRAKVRSFRGL